ncbi:MAG: radical SAM protein [Proteobacteria bacterium]|nr:radical SAM protein [Pseudomonadota bacterium]
MISPPLGIMYLASALRRKNHEVKIIDYRLHPGWLDRLQEELRLFSPEIVGLSSLTQEANSIAEIAAVAKKTPGVKFIIAGGAHPSAHARQILKDPNIDVVVLGEGEVTVPELIECLEAGKSIQEIAGIAGKTAGKIVENAPRPYVENLDRVPFPAWDLIDLKSYSSRRRFGYLPRRKYMSIMTSRGCPFSCIYCHKLFGKMFRPRSPGNVLAEMEELSDRYGMREFEIDDDVFNFEIPRAQEILERIEAKAWGVKLAFPNGLRGDRLNYEILGKFKSAGTYLLAMAVETVSPRLQKLIGKNLDLERVRQSAEDCRRLKITTLGFFMLGFPTETPEEARATVEWAVKSKFDFASFTMMVPYGGTRLWKSLEETGRISELPDFIDLDYHRSRYNLSEVPDRELFNLQRWAYWKFYIGRIFAFVFRGLLFKIDWENGIRNFSRAFFIKKRGFLK